MYAKSKCIPLFAVSFESSVYRIDARIIVRILERIRFV